MKEIKTKPPLGDKLPVKVLVGTVKTVPKAAVRAAGDKIKGAAEQKIEDFLETGNPQDQSPGANAGDTMVRGGEVIAEKTARAAVSTVKTGVKIGSAVQHARGATKTAKDLTADIQNVTNAAPTPEARVEVSPIKMRDTQPLSVKTRTEPTIKTAPADIKTMENSSVAIKNSVQQGAQPKANGGAPSAFSPDASDTAPHAMTQGKPNDSSIPAAKQNVLKIKERDAKIASAAKPAQAAPRAGRIKTRPQFGGTALQPQMSKPFTLSAPAHASTPAPFSSQTGSTSTPQKSRTPQIKTRTIAKTKTAPRGIKTNATKIRQVGAAAKKAKQAQAARKVAQKTAQQAVRVAKITAEKAAQAAKIIAKAVASAVKACIAALQSMFAALVAIGGTAFAVILIICLVALLAGSVLGIFFAAEPTGNGMPIQDAMSSLNEEYYSQISKIQEDVPHDHVEIKSSDGVMGIRWEDVLAVYAAKISGSDDAAEIVTMDESKLNILRTVLVDMNNVKYKTRVDSKEITVPVYDEDGRLTYDKNGNPITETQIITETTLMIELEHKTPAQMAGEYGFNANQNEALALLQDAQYASLWGQLLGGLTMNGSGEIITPDTDWNGTDIYAWPLPKSFSITSRFGYRKDPFTGKISYHGGTDIAAPYGTSILAAAAGTVTVANATDPWGFSYGYHVKLDHGAGKETLYAHCSSICVTPGQTVQQGEVIGYVGSTGNSTGNHLHFEVRIGGAAVDGMGYFS